MAPVVAGAIPVTHPKKTAPSPFRRDRLAYLAAYVALSTAYCWPILVRPLANGTGDWDQHLFYYASVMRNAAFGDWPFWNPWYCGGNVLWQNPQVPLVSPVYLLALVMPLTLAMKLNVLGHCIAGFLGMHLLLRRIFGVRSPIVVVYLGSLFVFSGAIALHLAAGHSVYLAAFYLPALLYLFFRAAAGDTRSAILGGVIVGAAILVGGAHVLPLVAVLLGSFGVGALLVARTAKPLMMAVLIVVAGAAYAAPKLVPAALFIRSADFHDRRGVKTPDFMSVEMLRRALWDGSQNKSSKIGPGIQRYAWHEYGNYLGWFGAGLALLGAIWVLLFRRRREYWREISAVIGLVFVLLLTAGEFAGLAPASLMRNLPFLSSFRIPSRHILLVPLMGAVCMAAVARVLEGSRTAPRRFAEILCAVALCQLAVVNRENLRNVFILPPTVTEARHLELSPPIVATEEPPSVTWTRLGENSMLLRTMEAGVSPLNCYEPLLLRRIAVPGPTWIWGEGDVTFTDHAFSPNRIAARVTVGNAPVRAVLNQNFANGWSSNVGHIERDPGSGRPSILLPAGYTGTVVFSFFPPGLWIGLAGWVLAIALSIFVWRRASAIDRRLYGVSRGA